MTDKKLSQQAKVCFSHIRKAERLINRLQSCETGLRSELTCQNHELKPDKAWRSGGKKTLEDTIIKIVDRESQINVRIDGLAVMQQEAFDKIKNIPDFDQQNILIAWYIQLRDWSDIAAELNLSLPHA